jgi:hypothetical protein
MTDDITSALRAVNHVVGGPGLFTSLDAATQALVERELRWTWLNGGDVLFRQGESGDAMYGHHGKLEALVETRGREPEVVGEISRGGGSAKWPSHRRSPVRDDSSQAR